MAEFQINDKVIFVSTGAKGIITEALEVFTRQVIFLHQPEDPEGILNLVMQEISLVISKKEISSMKNAIMSIINRQNNKKRRLWQS